MNLTDISSLKGKVANGGATSQGILTSENWNMLVSAVDELQDVSLVGVTPSVSLNTSSVVALLTFNTGNGTTKTCQITLPAVSESSAGVFTPAQLSEIKSLITAAQNTANTAANTATTAKDLARNGVTARFNGFVDEATIGLVSVVNPEGIYFVKSEKRFAAKYSGGYSNNWPDADKYSDDLRTEILKDKAYICDGKLYVWDADSETLVAAGFKELTDKIYRSVHISAIGDFFTSNLSSLLTGEYCGVWKVMSDKYCIGVLEVFCDGMFHCLSQTAPLMTPVIST